MVEGRAGRGRASASRARLKPQGQRSVEVCNYGCQGLWAPPASQACLHMVAVRVQHRELMQLHG